MCSSRASKRRSRSRAIGVELGRQLEDVYATLGDSAFGSIRQRLIRHLLLLASDGKSKPELRVQLTQQQLAGAIGSSREVVAREVARLRSDGLIASRDGGIELVDVDRLVASLDAWRAESPY